MIGGGFGVGASGAHAGRWAGGRAKAGCEHASALRLPSRWVGGCDKQRREEKCEQIAVWNQILTSAK